MRAVGVEGSQCRGKLLYRVVSVESGQCRWWSV